MIKHDIHIFISKVDSGDVGNGDYARIAKAKDVLCKVIRGNIRDKKHPYLITHGILTRRTIQSNTKRIVAFSRSQYGYRQALNHTIKALIDTGYLEEVPKEYRETNFNIKG